jgi:hypothetical protein
LFIEYIGVKDDVQCQVSGGWTLFHLFNIKKGGLDHSKTWNDELSEDNDENYGNEVKMF